MPPIPVLTALGELSVGLLAEAKLGTLGVVLLFMVGVWVRARRDGLAVAAALLLTVLMIQA
ncbi:hypothetical protein [Streptomyces fungicidicus]|uniref:Uncharacterized protein n=1 Tax=Streptomyces fungicidicus TaxID=68203 RepID=A0A494UPK5_9ACTN|nr:hypothetical protein [Streptomyces fungicidicus]AYL36793.1 hypothetical protein CNQ36_15975 [Streptomyces fungicidicus]